MKIQKGSIYWVDYSGCNGIEKGIKRPGLVIQNNVLNESKLNTALVIAITAALEFGKLPGNVILKKGEANMPWQGVVNVTQVLSVDKKKIDERIGSLPEILMEKVNAGLKLILELE